MEKYEKIEQIRKKYPEYIFECNKNYLCVLANMLMARSPEGIEACVESCDGDFFADEFVDAVNSFRSEDADYIEVKENSFNVYNRKKYKSFSKKDFLDHFVLESKTWKCI